MTQSTNPLQQFFRQPVIYIKLPSNGQYWSAGSLDMPVNSELPVLPMTAIDEITYRTPDALFNGNSVINVIQSCVPNIKNAWKIPSVDLNTVLIAIRLASVGQDMDIDTTCPSCGHSESYSVNLNQLLDTMLRPDYSEVITHGDLEVFFRPINYETQNQINVLQFEQQKIIQSVQDSDRNEDEKIQILNQALSEITKITVKAIGSSISGIRTPAALVSEQAYVEEFLNNCDRSLFNKIRDQAIKLRANSEIPPMKLCCTECNHNYEQPIIMDSANFFGRAS
jgi:hypothetical protein